MNLHICAVRRAGSFREQFALLFRDFLRLHPDEARQYADFKVALARQYTGVEDRHAYTDAKTPFIWDVISRADAWAQRTGWAPGPSDGEADDNGLGHGGTDGDG